MRRPSFRSSNARWGAAILVSILALWFWSAYFDSTTEKFDPGSHQTDIDRAQHLFDSDGVPILKIEGVGEQRHPAWIAIYALAYAGAEVYDDKLLGLSDKNKFEACIRWLTDNLRRKPNGLWVWEYGFDSTYNDVSIKAPWSSAFAQATGIQALLAAYRLDGRKDHLELAKKAAQPLFVAIREGGLLFESGDDIWFEEIPAPPDNPTHILNGHMRVLLALRELADITLEPLYEKWFLRGVATLERWLPRFDAGYWLRYDLNPQKKDLLFRFANPYGFANHPLAVDRITLRDPMSKQEVTLDVGTKEDAEGACRIAGTQWGQIEQLAGRTARKLVPVALENKPDEMASPHTYFYLSLPGEWKNNLRDQWFELIFDYYDDAPANITVQQRSVAPGQTFRDMREGDLHLTGTGQWRRWIVPVRPSDLGYWVGASYADKHRRYLHQIAKWDERFFSWSKVSAGYAGKVTTRSADMTEVVPETTILATQSPMLPIYSLDRDGVLMQHQASTDTKFLINGMFDPDSDWGVGRYSPYVIAEQLRQGPATPGAAYSRIKREDISSLPALRWFQNPKNQRIINGSVVYDFNFDNRYNDVETKSPWTSAFSQAYVLKALISAIETKTDSENPSRDLVQKVAASYRIPVLKGGITTYDRFGNPWFEEVPNATHVLNAHLVSIQELSHAARFLKEPAVQTTAESGIATLKERLHLYDTGYWLRYDQNPRKELLFQLDWLDGDKSPLIDEVLLENPQFGKFVRIDVGTHGDFEGPVRLSGSDWQGEQLIDGKSVRDFSNGYLSHIQAVAGGTQQNVYLVLPLPERQFADFFDVPCHRLIIRYKDTEAGIYAIKVQAIHEGKQLAFVPIRSGVWQCQGDQQWKEASFTIRPQEMGWYVGPDYQNYEVEQLQQIADLTNDWFLYQYAERHRYFLESELAGQPVIIQPGNSPTASKLSLPAPRVVSASATYPGHGFENALDGDREDDYVAALENQAPAFVTLDFGKTVRVSELQIDWENASNYAKQVVVSAVNQEGSLLRELAHIRAEPIGNRTQLPFVKDGEVLLIRIDFSDFAGQPRLLLRQLTFWGKVSE